jgi:hypothetical protein
MVPCWWEVPLLVLLSLQQQLQLWCCLQCRRRALQVYLLLPPPLPLLLLVLSRSHLGLQ